MKLEVGAKTDVGLVRDHNEDSFCVNIKNRIFIVADGMGGHAAGEVASNQLKDYIEEFIVRGENPGAIDRHLQEAVQKANRHIFEMGIEDPAKRGMGTTATILVFTEEHYFVAQVGDSRAYLLRNNELTQITRDHSKVFQLYEHGLITKDEIENHPFSNIITRSIGTKSTVEADIYRGPVREGDRFLLCSDGLTGEVNDSALCEVLRNEQQAQQVCEELVRQALRSGGRDNITILVVDIMAREGNMRQTVPISKKDVQRILAAEETRQALQSGQIEAVAAAPATTAQSPANGPSPAAAGQFTTGQDTVPEQSHKEDEAPENAPGDKSFTRLFAAVVGIAITAFLLMKFFQGPQECPVIIETVPPDAELYINGAYIGNSPYKSLLKPGEYTITAAKDGYSQARLLVKIKSGELGPKRKTIPLDALNERGL